MSRVVKGVLILLVMVGGAKGAHAESEQYCFHHLRALGAQIKRAEKAGCPITSSDKWHWTRDSNQQFIFCRNNEAKDIQYWHNQRESELTYCEANGTREPFQPAVFQDAPAWAPMVRLKLVQVEKTLHETRVVPTPPGGTIPFEIPTRVLNAVRCTTAVAQTGVCRTLDVYAESFRSVAHDRDGAGMPGAVQGAGAVQGLDLGRPPESAGPRGRQMLAQEHGARGQRQPGPCLGGEIAPGRA